MQYINVSGKIMVEISYQIKNKIKESYRKKANYVFFKKTDKIKIDNYFNSKESLEIKISPEKELLTKGDFEISGSWSEEVSVKTYYENGWFHTGQLTEIDDEGYIAITGYIKNERKKSLNKINNFFDSPTERNAVLLLLFIWLSLFFLSSL
jgi:long-subunit acyl-CoA synthetase (AMP-forming)